MSPLAEACRAADVALVPAPGPLAADGLRAAEKALAVLISGTREGAPA